MSTRVRWNTSTIKPKLDETHEGKYDYSKLNYTKMHDKVIIICAEHGEFAQTVNSHLRGRGCPKCNHLKTSKRMLGNKNSFVRRALKLHGSFYSYENSVYVDAHTKLDIECPVHGIFSMIPSNHVHSVKPQGCSLCADRVGWSRTAWVKSARGGQASLYVIRCSLNQEVFYKIGITVKPDIFKRFPGKTLPYSFECLNWITSSDAGAIFDLERTLHRLHKDLKYKPKISFAGDTECFSSILI